MDIEAITKDGFFINETHNIYSNIAFLSLRSALISYFHTSINLNLFLSNLELNQTQEEVDNLYSIRYAGDACDAIAHFHHFIELILKDILRKEHPLLVVDASDKPELLYKLVKGERIHDSEIEKLKQIEFSDTLNRILHMIKANKIDNSYNFISNDAVWLKKINFLRNRISHKGNFILRHNALNELFGKYILPFVIKITSLPEYSNIKIWKYKIHNDKTHPLEDIISEYSKKDVNNHKIQLLKLLANYAYNNPIHYDQNLKNIFNQESIEHAQLIAKQCSEKNWYNKKHICPVCGIEALVPEFDSYEKYNDEGEIEECQDYVYKVKCHCCSFELKSYIINQLSSLGINIEDYSKITR